MAALQATVFISSARALAMSGVRSPARASAASSSEAAACSLESVAGAERSMKASRPNGSYSKPRAESASAFASSDAAHSAETVSVAGSSSDWVCTGESRSISASYSIRSCAACLSMMTSASPCCARMYSPSASPITRTGSAGALFCGSASGSGSGAIGASTVGAGAAARSLAGGVGRHALRGGSAGMGRGGGVRSMLV